MVLNLANQVRELHHEKGISEDLIIKTIQHALTKAYEKYYGTIENLVITTDEEYVLSIFSRKDVVDNVTDDLREIDLDSARKIDKNIEIGAQVLEPCNPEDFGRIAIHSAKQIILQKLKEIQKNSLFSEYKSKQGEIIIGYIQRMKNDTIFIDIGNTEGMLIKKFQAPHETYNIGDRLKTIVTEVKQTKEGNVSVLLSRVSPDFVKKLLEVEVPEIADKTITIFKIVREAGYRTKIAVYSTKENIDPVGACVGEKGGRIQNIIKELEGEKIDVLKYSSDPKEFIANALIPAKATKVVITDDANKKAVVIVDESQLSFAIGKKGLNIRLANQITDWDIDIKTMEQAKELNLVTDHVQIAENLFKDEFAEEMDRELSGEEEATVESATMDEEMASTLKDLGLSDKIINALAENKIATLEQLVELESNSIANLPGFDTTMANELKDFIETNLEVVEEEEYETETEDGIEQDGVLYYKCPHCGGNIKEDQTKCPKCGVEISFEDE